MVRVLKYTRDVQRKLKVYGGEIEGKNKLNLNLSDYGTFNKLKYFSEMFILSINIQFSFVAIAILLQIAWLF